MAKTEQHTGLTEISAQLKAARAAAGLSLQKVSDELCIRRSYLEAMEAGRFDDLPPPAYTGGFLRSYARALGLDAEELSGAYRTAIGDDAIRAELQFPEPLADSRMPGGGAIAAGLVGLALIYVGWIHDFSGGSAEVSSRGVSDVPERLSVIPNAMATPAAVDRMAQVDEPGTPPVVEAELSVESSAEPAPVTAQAASADLSAPASGSDASAPDHDRVTLTAERDAWLYIVDSMDREVWAGVLREGQSWSPDRDGLTLMTGNAGGVLLSVGDRPARPLGEKGAVIRALPLDAGKLLQSQGG